MKARRTGLCSLAIAFALAAFPAGSAATTFVPPGNSAATQYTEAFPTAGGQQKAGSGGRHGSRSPGRVLGGRNAHRLAAQGAQGRAAAAVVAATAPRLVSGKATGGSSGAPHRGGSKAGTPSHAALTGGGSGPGSGMPGGSSGPGQIIGQATGASSSSPSVLLPLLIAVTAFWALTFLWRRRRRTAP